MQTTEYNELIQPGIFILYENTIYLKKQLLNYLTKEILPPSFTLEEHFEIICLRIKKSMKKQGKASDNWVVPSM